MSKQKRWRSLGVPPELTVRVLEKGKTTDLHITYSPTCRMLGVNLRNNLSWDSHLNSGKKAVLPTVRKLLGAISTLRFSLSQKGKLQLVNALIMSKISYLICIWGNTTSSVIRQTQIVQNIAARFVTGLPKSTRQRDLLSGCNWLNIRELCSYYSTVQYWKAVHLHRPEFLWKTIQEETELVFSTVSPRLQITDQSFRCKTTRYWNSLPLTLRQMTDIKHFKAGLRRHILDTRELNHPGEDENDGEALDDVEGAAGGGAAEVD